MTDLSISDLFLAGAGFDIAGGYLVARGLLQTPAMLARRAGTFVGQNPSAVIAAAEDRVDATWGLCALLCGFTVQAAGYVLGLGIQASSHHSASRAALGAIATVLAIAAVLSLWRGTRRRLLLRTLAAAACYDVNTGLMTEMPFAPSLILFASQLEIEPDENENENARAFAARIFRVPNMHPSRGATTSSGTETEKAESES